MVKMRSIILFTFTLFLFLLTANVSAHVENLHIHAIGWNGEYWLIGGRILPDGPTFLVTWDGEKFSHITSAELKHVWIGNISWSGREWIISELPATTLNKPRVFLSDGKTFNKTESTIEEIQREAYEVCNDNYCLRWKNIEGKLLRYNGKNYVDVTNDSGIQFPFEGVISMVWNGQYWLIGFGGTEGGGVVKYDGKSFTHLLMPTSTAGNAIAWNGEYWLIGTLSNPRFSGSLAKYDGAMITDLTPELWKALEEQESIQPTTIEPIPQREEPTMTEPTTIQPEKLTINYRNTALAIIAVLLIASYLYWKKRKSRPQC